MIDKTVPDAAAAVAGIPDGATVLIGAHRSDRMGNLVYRKTARNFGPVMATAATTTIVQVADVVETGELDPEAVVTPCIYVDRVVQV